MRVNESAAASTKVVGAAAKYPRVLYRVLTLNRNTVFLAIVHDLLLDLFACHHSCYDCKG